MIKSIDSAWNAMLIAIPKEKLSFGTKLAFKLSNLCFE
jgi:hypothetical protein